MKREERKCKEKDHLKELILNGGLKDEVVKAWCRDMRKEKSAFYDRLAELPDDDRTRYESLIDRRKIDDRQLRRLIEDIEDEDEVYKATLKRNRGRASRVTKKRCANGGARDLERRPSLLRSTGGHYHRQSGTW